MDFSKVRNYIFLGGLIAVTALFATVLAPYAYPIFWAAVIAGISYPFFNWFEHRFKHPNLSSILTLMVVILLIFIPLLIVGALLVAEALRLLTLINDRRSEMYELLRSIGNFLRNSPLLSRWGFDEQALADKFTQYGNFLLSWFLSKITAIAKASLEISFKFVVMLYTLFFFIRDGKSMLLKLMHLMPLGDRYEQLLYNKFTSTVRATLKGTLLIALLQGTLGSILFIATGIPGALIWGLVMFLLSLLPNVGSFLVWLPVGVTMIVAGHPVKGIIILAVGALVISTVDNFLRPILVGKDLKLHPLMIFLSVLGGISVFNISGFIIGPIIASLFLSFWEIYEHYYHKELTHN